MNWRNWLPNFQWWGDVVIFALCIGFLLVIVLLAGCATGRENYGDLPAARMIIEQPNRWCFFWCRTTTEQTTVFSPGAQGAVSASGGDISEVEMRSTAKGDTVEAAPPPAPTPQPTPKE